MSWGRVMNKYKRVKKIYDKDRRENEKREDQSISFKNDELEFSLNLLWGSIFGLIDKNYWESNREKQCPEEDSEIEDPLASDFIAKGSCLMHEKN